MHSCMRMLGDSLDNLRMVQIVFNSAASDHIRVHHLKFCVHSTLARPLERCALPRPTSLSQHSRDGTSL